MASVDKELLWLWPTLMWRQDAELQSFSAERRVPMHATRKNATFGL